MVNVLMLSPGFPKDLGYFTRGLAQVGARVYGMGDQPLGALEPEVRAALTDYRQVRTLWDGEAVVDEVRTWLKGKPLDRAECLWEPGMEVVAQIREAFGLPGLGVKQSKAFRDKELMKQVLDEAGIRTPRHRRASNEAECRAAAEAIGYPLIIKPIDGAGSADTYHLRDDQEFDKALRLLRHVPEVSVEEYIDGEEYTFDTITAGGKIAYHNIAWYRPRPLVARSNEWISPQVIALRDVDAANLQDGVKMGFDVIKALGFDAGFTHMEWYRKADGEVVFGEIGARPPGAHQVDQMKFACDFDVFRAWGQAVTSGQIDAKIARKYNVATVYKRARGVGRITRYEGVDALQQRYGKHVVWNTLLPPGTPRRDWRKTLVSDGFVMLRHPDLNQTLEMADAVGSDLQIFAE